MSEQRAIAWHGEPVLHESAMQRMREHVDADKVHNGFGWWNHERQRGCWVGCIVSDAIREQDLANTTIRYPQLRKAFGFSESLSNWIEGAFETAEKYAAPLTAEYLTAVIPVKFDSTNILPNFHCHDWCVVDRNSTAFWVLLAQLQRMCEEQGIPLELDPVKLLPHRFPQEQYSAEFAEAVTSIYEGAAV